MHFLRYYGLLLSYLPLCVSGCSPSLYPSPMHAYQIDYPEIADGVTPRHRFMSAYEQRVEPPDRQWQYLLFAAEPYETIAFKVHLYMYIIYTCCIYMCEGLRIM